MRPSRSIFRSVLVATVAAGLVAVGAATTAAAVLVRSSQEGSLVDSALVRAHAARDGVDRDLALARADLRTAAVSTAAGDPLAVTTMLSSHLTALRCIVEGEEVLDAAASPDARLDLRSRPIPEPGEVVVIGEHTMLASVRVGNVIAEGLIDSSASLRMPSGWHSSLVARPQSDPDRGHARDGVVVRRQSEGGNDIVRIVAPQNEGVDVVIHAPLAPARAAADETTWRVVQWSMLSLPVLFALAWLLSRRVTAPIVALARAVTAAPAERLHLPPMPGDEIGKLGAAIAVMSSRLRGDARVLSMAAAFARRVGTLREADEVTRTLEGALRETVPEVRWTVVPASRIVDGVTDDGHAIPAVVLDEPSGEDSVRPTAGRIDETALVQSSALVDQRHRRIYLAIREASTLYGIVIGEADVSDTIPVGVAELFVRSAASALRTLDLFRSAITNEKLAALGRLATSVAHEMNNPLASVLANASTLEAQLDGELRETASDIREGAERLGRIVSDVSSVARDDRPRQSSLVELGILVDTAVKLVSARGHRAIVVFSDPGVLVRVDSGRVEQAVVNLLANAIDATRDVASPRVDVRVRASEGVATIEVSDNGRGIPRAVQTRLFEWFVSTKGAQGTGLGLYLSRQFIQAQGGDIVLAASGPTGTMFRITLPIAAPIESVRPVESVRVERCGTTDRPHVLVLDDEEIVLRALARTLGRSAEVTTTMDPVAAIELAATGRFSLVITDFHMPSMRGDEFIARVRARTCDRGPRMVIMSGAELPMLLGVQTLTKPFGREELDAVLASS